MRIRKCLAWVSRTWFLAIIALLRQWCRLSSTQTRLALLRAHFIEKSNPNFRRRTLCLCAHRIIHQLKIGQKEDNNCNHLPIKKHTHECVDFNHFKWQKKIAKTICDLSLDRILIRLCPNLCAGNGSIRKKHNDDKCKRKYWNSEIEKDAIEDNASECSRCTQVYCRRICFRLTRIFARSTTAKIIVL